MTGYLSCDNKPSDINHMVKENYHIEINNKQKTLWNVNIIKLNQILFLIMHRVFFQQLQGIFIKNSIWTTISSQPKTLDLILTPALLLLPALRRLTLTTETMPDSIIEKLAPLVAPGTINQFWYDYSTVYIQ